MSTSTSERPTTEASRLRPQDRSAAEGAPADAPAGRRSPWFVVRRTLAELREDRGGDAAAALTFWNVASLVPALALLLGLVGLTGRTVVVVDVVDEVLTGLLAPTTVDLVTGRLRELDQLSFVGSAVLVGASALVLLWAASGYVRAFARTANTAHEVREGRAAWRLRPTQLVLAVVLVALVALALAIMVATGPVARALGGAFGLSSDLVSTWSVVQWPLLALVVVGVVALLFHLTPNVRFARFRVLTAGAFLAVLVWVAASVAVAVFVATYGTYDRTVGSLAGAVVLLLWLWVTNLALVLGTELDAELERGRQLQHGVAAEERLQRPVRDGRGIERADRRRERDLDAQRAIRVAASSHGNPADRPFGRAVHTE